MKNTNFKIIKISANPKGSFPFVPGAFLISLGLLVLFFPKLFIAAISALFLFLGCIFCYCAWKFIQFRKRFEAFTKDVESKIQVQSFHINPNDVIEIEKDEKKIIFH